MKSDVGKTLQPGPNRVSAYIESIGSAQWSFFACRHWLLLQTILYIYGGAKAHL